MSLLRQDPPSLSSLDRHLVSLLDPTSFEAEQYRRLRQHIEYLNTSRPLRVIAMTSAVASDGKTLTALNFAGTLAQAHDARILLIDADLRRPSVAALLGMQAVAGPGLSGAVQAPRGRLNDFVKRVGGSSLFVLPCGESRSDTYELLTSPRLLEVLDDAKRQYDYVVIDTPPIVPVPDGVLLAKAVDGYLVVVGANSTPRKLLAEALNLLDGSQVIGLIYNRDRRPLFGYYHSRYRSYFKHYVRSLNQTA